MSTLQVNVTGLNELQNALADTPEVLEQALGHAAKEIGSEILNTEGLRKYPPTGKANRPPTPYYIRGQGMVYARYDDFKSEHLGQRYYVETRGMNIAIGNSASYARFVSGGEEDQARAMAAIGWRQLPEVAEEKLDEITRIYDGFVERELKKLGL